MKMQAETIIERLLIGGGRGGGRTTAAIKVTRETPGGVLVVATERDKRRIAEIAPDIEIQSLEQVAHNYGMQPLYIVDHFALETLLRQLNTEINWAYRNTGKEK